MSLYEPGMAMMWTSQGPWLVQMTAGQIIALSAPQCQFNSIGRGELKKSRSNQNWTLTALMKLPPSSNFRPLLGKVSSKKYPDDIEGHWSLLKSTILATSKPILGYKSRKLDYRGISRLSTTGKVLACVLANRLLPLAEEVLPESQCGFRPSRGTADMIFTVRQLQEKCCEQRQPLYMAFTWQRHLTW